MATASEFSPYQRSASSQEKEPSFFRKMVRFAWEKTSLIVMMVAEFFFAGLEYILPTFAKSCRTITHRIYFFFAEMRHAAQGESLQEQRERIEALEKKVETLQGEKEALEAQLQEQSDRLRHLEEVELQANLSENQANFCREQSSIDKKEVHALRQTLQDVQKKLSHTSVEKARLEEQNKQYQAKLEEPE